MADDAGRTDRPREVELKLELDPRDAARLGETTLLRGLDGRTRALATVYFDTPGHDLRKAGLSLRVRAVEGARSRPSRLPGSAAAGLFDRDEWEAEIDHAGPDLTAAAGTALEPLLAGGPDGPRPISPSGSRAPPIGSQGQDGRPS